MALCDQLEAAQHERESRRDRLTIASHHHLNDGAKEEVFQNRAQVFLDQLSQLSICPIQIKQLRQTILNLAVTGRLKTRQSEDESVATILKRSVPLPDGYSRRRKILKRSSVRSLKETFPSIPSSWQYCEVQSLYDLNVIIDYADGNHGSLYPRANEFGDSGVTFVTAKDLSGGRILWEQCSRLNEHRAKQLTKGWAKGGDVLLTHNATVGRVARVEPCKESFLLGTSVTFYRLNKSVLDANYFFHFLQSGIWQDQLEAIMQQTTRNQVSIQKQAFFLVAIPPLAEQHRIVSKVDGLMTLCDQLEISLATTQIEASRLLESVLHRTLEPHRYDMVEG
jgi:type I restriction enzyme S subunit